MMCAERIWYVGIAIILGLIMGLVGSGLFVVAFFAQLAVMGVLLMRGIMDRCPSEDALRQILPSCDETEDFE